MEANLTSIAGFVPAVILPTATFLQLLKILRVRSAHGVSVMTWLLFGFANLGLYIFIEKYFEIQAILSLLLTAVLDFIIIGVIVYRNRKEKADTGC